MGCKIDLRDSIIKLINADLDEVELKIDDGDIKWTKSRNIEVQLDKGRIDYLKEGDETVYEVQIQCRYTCLKSSTGDDLTVYEFLTGTGNASGSSYFTECDDGSDLTLSVLNDLLTSDPDLHWSLFTDFKFTKIDGSFKDGVLDITGLAKGLDSEVA